MFARTLFKRTYGIRNVVEREEALREFYRVLKENGLVMESAEKSNEIFSFKVGKHVFEGKVTKIKKLA